MLRIDRRRKRIIQNTVPRRLRHASTSMAVASDLRQPIRALRGTRPDNMIPMHNIFNKIKSDWLEKTEVPTCAENRYKYRERKIVLVTNFPTSPHRPDNIFYTNFQLIKMTDESRVSLGDDRSDKRKVDDFTALYNLDTTTTGRGLVDNGMYRKSVIRQTPWQIKFIPQHNSF